MRSGDVYNGFTEEQNLESRMKRRAPYNDPRINPYSSTERITDRRLPHELGAAKYIGISENFHKQDEPISRPSNNESRWQMSQNGYQMPNTVPSHPLHEDQGNIGRRSYHQVYALNSITTTNFEKHDNREAAQHEEDMEIGYEDTGPSPLTFDGLERKFNNEILKLVQEQSDLEDAEITRHKERLMEINTQYQQQLLSVRTRQAAQRQEFLQKESDARRYQFQRPGIQEFPNSMTAVDFHQYSIATGGSSSVAAGGVSHQYKNIPTSSSDATRPYSHIPGEPARGYRDLRTQVESSYGQQDYKESIKTSDATGRVPYPEGRVYNTGPRYR